MIASLQVRIEILESRGMPALDNVYEIAGIEKNFHVFRLSPLPSQPQGQRCDPCSTLATSTASDFTRYTAI
jgi:hypothetical protein